MIGSGPAAPGGPDPAPGSATAPSASPDAPVSRFELKLFGGKGGLLENSHDLCTVGDRARFGFTGQNGKVEKTEPKVAVTCGKHKRLKGKKGHKRNAKKLGL